MGLSSDLEYSTQVRCPPPAFLWAQMQPTKRALAKQRSRSSVNPFSTFNKTKIIMLNNEPQQGSKYNDLRHRLWKPSKEKMFPIAVIAAEILF